MRCQSYPICRFATTNKCPCLRCRSVRASGFCSEQHEMWGREQREIQDWLKKNNAILAERGIDEIAYLAIAAGFNRTLVYEELSHYATDRISHSKYPDREWFYIQREIDYLSPLKEQWDRLCRHQMGAD